ncbi:MAG: DUF1223 domain-containing protein [Rhizobacter sp.]
MRPHTLRRALLPLVLLPLVASAVAQTCNAKSGSMPATVVELYTSEGCNSCPPADKWLSALPARADVVALAMHVDYWDHLGWRDRLAARVYTDRQTYQQRVNGSRYNYTPQVVVNGRDRKDWSSLKPPALTATPVEITLAREGAVVNATVRSSSTTQLAAYWAVTEMGHRSAVRAGENAGVTLLHDHVVRELQEVPAWKAGAGALTQLQFRPGTPADAGHPRHVNLVVVDAATGRPVQALKLAC